MARPDRVPLDGCASVEWAVHATRDWPVRFDDEPVEPVGRREVCRQVTTGYTLFVDAADGAVSQYVLGTAHISSYTFFLLYDYPSFMI